MRTSDLLNRQYAGLLDGAHRECPYSKATHGNINVVTNLIDTESAAPVA